MKRNDLIFIGMTALVAAVWLLVQSLVFSETGYEVTVTQDGRAAGTFALGENKSLSFTDSAGGKNTLRIQDGEAYMSYADCPDRLCMHQKAISKKGESIICLPHRLVITVSKGETGEIDAMTR